ncbi:DUF2510 domain-containing protein [Flavimobilis sp. GY10621]|uniref:DUF2510 domain-containing protein n=1 Tax=Flavimobilis rhizosphaerae TaxID=2775421 RepID=A0ABR9DQC3_9MICO|nr:DUF2510 domain-containing protein [Flavimobilis rhizosphaerae]MBD9699320.1 DUF2510 domain-containing protein [Flavimobilis rhizosphaerae]
MTAQPPPLPGSTPDGPVPSGSAGAPRPSGTGAVPRGTVTAPGGGGDVLVGPAGWYPHPDGRERWWDGTAWTELARTGGKVAHVDGSDRTSAARDEARGRRRGAFRFVGGLVALLLVWALGNAVWDMVVERNAQLERTTPTERARSVLNAPRGLATGDDACPTTDRQLVDPAAPGVARWRELRGCGLTPALDRKGWEWVTRPTEESPTAVVDYTFAKVEDAKRPDAKLGGTTVRLTLTLEKAFLGWKVSAVEGLPARAKG